MGRILLVGVPGAGKTTTGRLLQEMKIVKYEPSGERKKEILKSLNITESLSCMNQTSSSLINALYFYVVDNMECHRLPLLIDTHASYGLADKSFVSPPCLYRKRNSRNNSSSCPSRNY